MSFLGWYVDPVYFLIFFLTILISIGAQVMVSSSYRKRSAVKNGAWLTGGQRSLASHGGWDPRSRRMASASAGSRGSP